MRASFRIRCHADFNTGYVAPTLAYITVNCVPSSGRTAFENSIRQRAVRIGDADRRLRESQRSCQQTAPASDLVNLYLRTNEDETYGSNGYTKPTNGAIRLRLRQSRGLSILFVSNRSRARHTPAATETSAH